MNMNRLPVNIKTHFLVLSASKQIRPGKTA